MKELEVVHLADLCSIGVERRLPPKIKDLRSFTIPCVINEGKINKALCDLGASINDFEIGDQSAHSPMRVVEDVLVKVHKIFFLVDFFDFRDEGR